KVCVTFDESEKYFPQNKTIVTGLPVRPEIISGMDKRLARESLGLDPDKFTVLVFGGSQGAKRINEMVLDAAGHLLSAGLQVVHQSGKKNYDEVISRQPKVDGYVILPYIEDMATAYSAADLVVSRSGASSIAEITVSGLPSILIPYPFAHANHQKANAQAVSRAGGAIILEESEIDGQTLAGVIIDLAEDKNKLAAMAEASRRIGRPDAVGEIVQVVLDVAK
ncbi:MAG TPA: UDP-N-acetylglucosamine--N-acetylmuramyl-(pentapeptide) pyrophosphoryl-undecaprenol N-acetylglucosamine transferase, partial [Armatimonadota bacterium]|nr:UDP-N-acetylglucosamine--N-acetylmuramyl-(pentapeptide) pyrophosphoryl-undecaprenol N-acetylglucosamine transferase [Armatimonadota bacterium]